MMARVGGGSWAQSKQIQEQLEGSQTFLATTAMTAWKQNRPGQISEQNCKDVLVITYQSLEGGGHKCFRKISVLEIRLSPALKLSAQQFLKSMLSQWRQDNLWLNIVQDNSQGFLLVSQGLELQHMPLASSEASLRNASFPNGYKDMSCIWIFPNHYRIVKHLGISLHCFMECWDLPSDICEYMHKVSHNMSEGTDWRWTERLRASRENALRLLF